VALPPTRSPWPLADSPRRKPRPDADKATLRPLPVADRSAIRPRHVASNRLRNPRPVVTDARRAPSPAALAPCRAIRAAPSAARAAPSAADRFSSSAFSRRCSRRNAIVVRTYLCHSKPSLLRRQGHDLDQKPAIRVTLRQPSRGRSCNATARLRESRSSVSMREKHGPSAAPRAGTGPGRREL
jgi:hypothetical protein